MSKTVYQCDDNWVFLGETFADESPLEPGVYLIPAGCVELAPPAFNPETHRAKWRGADWLVEEIPVPPPPPPPSREEIIAKKSAEILVERSRRTQGGIYASGHWYPSDLTAQEHWAFLRGLAREIKFDGGDMDEVMRDASGNPWRWQTLDAGEVDMTANLVIAITNQGAANQNKNFQNAKRHKALLEQSVDPSSYDFSDGWTEIWEG